MPKFNTRVEVREVNPFGAPDPATVTGEQRDRFWVTGYSDKRREWDREYARYVRGERGTPPRPLDFRLQFVSVERASGSPDARNKADFTASGYRPLAYDEAKRFGLDLGDSAAVKDAEGNIRVGSQILMVADRAHASARFAQAQRNQESQERDIEERLAATAADANRAMGTSKGGGTAFGPFELDNASE